MVLDSEKMGAEPEVKLYKILSYILLDLPFTHFKPIGRYLRLCCERKPDDREALVTFCGMLRELRQRVKPIPVEVVYRGFEGLETAVDMLRQKKVSGEKLMVV